MLKFPVENIFFKIYLFIFFIGDDTVLKLNILLIFTEKLLSKAFAAFRREWFVFLLSNVRIHLCHS